MRALPEAARAILLVRHAERGPIVDVATHREVLLTPAGHEAARAAGHLLAALAPRRAGRVRLLHSPVERCAETARGIGHGLRERDVEHALHGEVGMLGEHYVRDVERGNAHARQHRHAYLRAWLDGVIPDDVLVAKREAGRGQLRAVVELAPAAGDLTVMVTHDWNIALLRETLLGLTHEAFGWPGFLDGILFVVEAYEVRVRVGAHDAVLDLRAL